jgi:hypothetical protein
VYAKDAVVVLLDSGELHSGLLAYFCTLWARAAPLEIISVVDNAQDTDMHKSTTLQAAAVPPKDYRAVQEKIPVLEISSYSLKKKWFQVLRH